MGDTSDCLFFATQRTPVGINMNLPIRGLVDISQWPLGTLAKLLRVDISHFHTCTITLNFSRHYVRKLYVCVNNTSLLQQTCIIYKLLPQQLMCDKSFYHGRFCWETLTGTTNVNIVVQAPPDTHQTTKLLCIGLENGKNPKAVAQASKLPRFQFDCASHGVCQNKLICFDFFVD